MKKNNKNKKIVASLLLAGALVIPMPAQAIGVSARVSVSRPSVSVSRPTSSYRPVSTTTVARGRSSHSSSRSSHTSIKSTTKTTTTKSKSTVIKADSGKFTSKKPTKTTTTKKTTINVTKHYTVKPKKTIKYVKTKPTYYSHYSATPVVYNQGLGFWDYYLLGTIFKDKDEVTDRDIAKELESRGYSQSEVDNILKEAKDEQKQTVNQRNSFWDKFWSFIGGLFKWTLIIGAVLLILLLIAKIFI